MNKNAKDYVDHMLKVSLPVVMKIRQIEGEFDTAKILNFMRVEIQNNSNYIMIA